MLRRSRCLFGGLHGRIRPPGADALQGTSIAYLADEPGPGARLGTSRSLLIAEAQSFEWKSLNPHGRRSRVRRIQTSARSGMHDIGCMYDQRSFTRDTSDQMDPGRSASR